MNDTPPKSFYSARLNRYTPIDRSKVNDDIMDGKNLAKLGIDPGAFDSATFDRELSNVFEAFLRDAADRIDAQMRAVRARHLDAAAALKGSIVTKTDYLGRPVFAENGRPENQRLVFWYELRFDRMPARGNGITFPNLYWFRRSGGNVTVKRGPSRGKKVCVGHRVPPPKTGSRYSVSLFTAANGKERELIEETETRAEPLRVQARFYSDLWQRVRAYRLSAAYRSRYPESEAS